MGRDDDPSDANSRLSERQCDILHAVVEDYIETAEPVGSRSLTKRNRAIDLSPATVRNAMSDLEDLGYLSAPHASAGRIPTAQAFRVYVERMASRGRLTPRDRDVINAALSNPEGPKKELSFVLQEASRALSSLSNQASLILFPRLDSVIFESIDFVPIRERTVLAVFVAKSGLVQQRVVDVEFALDRDELRRMSNYLNSLLDGKTLIEVRAAIFNAMQDERAAADEVMKNALSLGERIIQEPAPAAAPALVVDGERNFLEHPEFADLGKMRKIFRAFEEKTILLRLLDAAATRPSEGAHREGNQTAVYFGAEQNVRELHELAAVMTSYQSPEGPAGQVGVVGPMRMDYSRVIPLVELTADTLSRSLGADPPPPVDGEGRPKR
ncbi:MAG: heat-inducible transcriptional repressor HrcA [Myxococcota bacterium]